MRHVIASFCAALIAVPVCAQTTPSAAQSVPVKASAELDRRLAELVVLLNGSGDYAATFAPAFVTAVPKTGFDGLAGQLTAAGGKALRVEIVKAVTPHSAVIVIVYERGRADGQIALDQAGTQQIASLRILGMSGTEASLGAVDAELAKLPGKTAFALAKLGTSAPQMLVARSADMRFAIGSEFKLVILAELIRGIEAGERRWEDTVTLDGAALPGGAYTQTAAGTKVTLYDLAAKMISVSDNSATDILLRALGREKVEAMLPVVGIADPSAMRPFLGTLEVFKLKSSPLGPRYAAADEKGRRALLAGDVAAMPITAIDTAVFAAGKPLMIDTLEWFATPADMIRAMDWLRRHTESGPAARARTILAINPAVSASVGARWRYAGYKGGSEPGVIAMTWLLQGKDGTWYAMSGSWNNIAAAVDDARFAGLMTRAVELAVSD